MFYKIDLHIHTKRYSECAPLFDPKELPNIIKKKLLSGVVITEHDIMWPSTEISNLLKNHDKIKIYRGIEVSSRDGHYIVIGLDDSKNLYKGIPISDLINIAHKQNAVVILAHHHLSYSTNRKIIDVYSLPDKIDAIEVASTKTYDINEQEAFKISKNRNWHAVAGSDAHILSNVGSTYTLFPILPKDEKELASIIKLGLGIPVRAKTKKNI